MKEAEKKVTIESVVEFMGSWRILRIPKEAVKPLGLSGNSRRVVCAINDSKPFQCALFPVKKGGYFITASKELRQQLKIADGDKVRIEIKRDTSKYGLPMSPEFREVLRQDPEGRGLFHAMTPGNQRLSIRLVDEKTDSDKRITRAMILLAYLKDSKGKFDYHQIANALKKTIPRSHED
jgi:bifunctional DNA-binding transcriptional regulator/antitoxin component of YhaV-PrlF toxin-antitoxin module